jgi:ABC-type multidrug transport system permease subunit
MRVMRVIRVLRVVLKIIKLIKNAIHLTLSLITFVLLVFGRIPVNSSHFSLYFVSILSPKYYILKVLMCSFNKRNCTVDKSLKIIKLITLKMQSD